MSNSQRHSEPLAEGLQPLVCFKKNKELLRLLDAMQSIILFISNDWRIEHANAFALQWRSTPNLLQQSLDTLLADWDKPEQRRREIEQVLDSRCAQWNSLESVKSPKGLHWYRVDKIPTSGATGKLTGLLLVMMDVTDSVLKEHALRKSDDRYRAFINNSADAIWCYEICPPISTALTESVQVDQILARASISECNEKLARLFGVSRVEELIGLPIHKNGSFSNKSTIETFVKNGYRLEDQEFMRINRLGDRAYMQSSAIGIVEDGHLTRAWGTTRDITEKKIYLDRMEYLATHDPLTSLPNRTLLLRKMDEAFSSQRDFRKMALLLIDLDRFKEINDTLGHLEGDKVLKLLGPRLEVELGDTYGVVARLGGDEFAIFLPNIRNAQHAVVMAHRFLDSISQVFELETFQTEISASIGVALAPDHGDDATTLLRYADVAMYHAKHHMKGVSLYDANYDAHSPKRLELMGALGRAIREGQLYLQYQPKISLSDNRVYGLEALLRWRHPQMGNVPPGDFVPIAEMSSMIYAMTAWVLEETIRQCASWRKQGKDLCCAMNLSARNLLDDRIVNDLARFLNYYKLDGKYLEMEITESTLMADPDRAQIALEKINALGVQLAVDDYGTGYSSLAYLKRLPVQFLKIDGSFVQGMQNDEQDEIIVHSTIQLAHNLGLRVVAEGVEDEIVLRRLRELGCDNAQGYFIARPLDVDQVMDWLETAGWN